MPTATQEDPRVRDRRAERGTDRREATPTFENATEAVRALEAMTDADYDKIAARAFKEAKRFGYLPELDATVEDAHTARTATMTEARDVVDQNHPKDVAPLPSDLNTDVPHQPDALKPFAPLPKGLRKDIPMTPPLVEKARLTIDQKLDADFGWGSISRHAQQDAPIMTPPKEPAGEMTGTSPVKKLLRSQASKAPAMDDDRAQAMEEMNRVALAEERVKVGQRAERLREQQKAVRAEREAQESDTTISALAADARVTAEREGAHDPRDTRTDIIPEPDVVENFAPIPTTFDPVPAKLDALEVDPQPWKGEQMFTGKATLTTGDEPARVNAGKQKQWNQGGASVKAQQLGGSKGVRSFIEMPIPRGPEPQLIDLLSDATPAEEEGLRNFADTAERAAREGLKGIAEREYPQDAVLTFVNVLGDTRPLLDKLTVRSLGYEERKHNGQQHVPGIKIRFTKENGTMWEEWQPIENVRRKFVASRK